MDKEIQREIRTLLDTNPDWEYVRKHLDPASKTALSTLYTKNKITIKVTESLGVIQLLNESHIEFVVLKGITFWIHQKDREMGDLDILLKPDDIVRTAHLLETQLGYTYTLRDFRMYGIKKGHHLSLTHHHTIPVELHYAPFDCFYDHSFDFLKHKEYITIDSVSVPILTKELRLLSIFLHSFYNHGFLDRHDRMRSDIQSVINDPSFDWDTFITLVDKLDCNEIVLRANVPLPENVYTHIKSHASAIRLYLTRSFDPSFLIDRTLLRERVVTNPHADTLWRMRNSLRFSFGWNKRFFRLVWIYLWVFTLRGPDIWAILNRKI